MKLKHLLLSILSLFYVCNAIGQGSLEYQLTVFDKDGGFEVGLEIAIVEASSFEIIREKTDENGQMSILIDKGQTWVMHIGEMKAHTVLKIMPNMKGKASENVVYDLENWKRSQKSPKSRDNLKLSYKISTPKMNEISDGKHAIIEVFVKRPNAKAWSNMPVNLFCYQNQTIYEGYTNALGKAAFKVPMGQNYQVDVNGEIDFYLLEMEPGVASTVLNLTFDKINFSEKTNADGHTVQTFHETVRPVSNRVMVTLKVKGGPKGGEVEDVLIKTSGRKQKYYGKTGLNGEIVFLLPRGHVYQVDFPFQEDAKAIDLTRFFGISELMMNVYYDADPRLQFPERYLPTALELKEYDINAFNRSKPDSLGKNLVNVKARWGNNVVNSGSKEAILELGFSINKDRISKVNRKPINLSFVLDRSGSMSGDKIEILKNAMIEFIEKLQPTDKISIIFFESNPSLAYEQQSANQKDLQDIIYALQAYGGTNIYEGLKMGYEQLSKNYESSAVNRVILLTDGHGSKPINEVLKQSEKYFQKGISVSTIGVGSGYNQSLLSMLSKYSGGFEHQVMTSEDIQMALTDEYHSLFSPIARQLKVEIKYNKRIIYKTLYGIPEAKSGSNFVTFEQSEVFSTLKKMALVKFKLENPNKSIELEEIEIIVSYIDESTQKLVVEKQRLTLEWTPETDIELIHDQNLKTMYSVATVNQCIKVIADYCDNKEYRLAEDMVKETLNSLRKTNHDNFREDLLPLIEELETYLKGLKRL